MSAHHYFRDFFYCDSGMIPWLLVAKLVSQKAQSLSEPVDDRINRYPSPGEINSKLKDPASAIARVHAQYESQAIRIDYTDGMGVELADWRFNLRSSNTEPVVRLNVGSCADVRLPQTKTDEILKLLKR
jgi:phosphomannomutase